MDMIEKDSNFHFIAIGGVGMSGLAKYLLEDGLSVSGSDVSEGKYFSKVTALGAKTYIGHDENNLPENSVVIASTAIKEDNPELQKAKRKGMKILHRSDMLKFIAENFQAEGGKFIGFSGTHGKTTTSGLAAYVMEKAGLEPSYVVGGFIPEYDTNAKHCSGKYFTAELDESDGTILKYTPDVIVVNNIEVDHVDFYTDGLNSLLSTFTTFISNLKSEAKVLINKDCEGNKKLISVNPDKKFITYGFSEADYTARNVKHSQFLSSFDFYKNDEKICTIELSILGKHNVCNALAVAAALMESGINVSEIAKYFKGFSGMGRRYQLVAQIGELSIIDDYAHHPSEIKATLDCARGCNPEKPITAIFQPHRYTRLHGLYNDFLKCFDSADKVVVLDTYAASELPINGHTSEEFAKDLGQILGKDKVYYVGGKISEIASSVADVMEKDGVVLTLGAGDVTKLGHLIADLIKA